MKDMSIKCVLNLMKSGKINETHPSQLDQTSENYCNLGNFYEKKRGLFIFCDK